MTRSTCILASMVLIAGAAHPAAAQDSACLDAAEELASVYELDINPPDLNPVEPEVEVDEGLGVSPEDLADSGGVIDPPDVSSEMVIEPPEDVIFPMPTLPHNADIPLESDDLAVLGSILMAARYEALEGNESDCIEQLNKAAELLDGRT